MAYTAPITWSAYAVVTKAQMDQQVRDNISWLANHNHDATPGSGAGTLLLGDAGSVSAAALGRNGDPDTGLYFPAANQLGLAAGGSGFILTSAMITSNLLNSAALVNRSRWLWIPAAEMFDGGLGAPVLTNVGAWAVRARGWALRDGVADGITTDLIPVPADWASGTVQATIMFWAPAAAGNIVFDATQTVIAYDNTESPTAANDVTDSTFTVAATSNLFFRNLPTALTIAASKFLKFSIDRDGANASDTCAVTVYVAGLLLAYTADM